MAEQACDGQLGGQKSKYSLGPGQVRRAGRKKILNKKCKIFNRHRYYTADADVM